jgi:ABC-type transporter Mla subunit MlaD
MSSPQYHYPVPPPPAPNANLKIALATGAIIASLAANGFLLFQVHDLRSDTVRIQQTMQMEIDALKETGNQMTAEQRKHVEDLREELENKSRQLNMAASQAKREALSYADEQAKRLETQQQKNAQEVNTALSDVKQRADTANQGLQAVNTDVGNVKTDLASTKTDLNQTKSNLQKVAGDLGVTSGYVATNGKELEELKRRGERNYVEFTIHRQKQMQRVGDISLKLDKADAKHNKFTLDVLADDKSTQKKDRNINEPLQFYVSKSLYEIVVNSVGKDQISGYLSTPKYQARNQ